MDKHPQPTTFFQFGRGSLPDPHSREVVRHLLTDCEVCRQTTAGLLPPYPGRPRAGWRADYGQAFSSSLREVELRQEAWAVEQAAAPDRLRELLAQPAERHWAMVTQGTRYHSWAFCDLLLDASRELGFQDPARALDLSRIGVEIATRLSSEIYGAARVNDLVARAWGTLGNAQRIRSDFSEAENSLAKAERMLRKGTSDPLEKAQILLFKSSLLGNQQRFQEAFRLLDRVEAIGRRCDDPHLCGRAQITRGFLLGLGNDPEAAIRHLTEGIRLVDPALDPRLLVAAHHNLTLYLTESGRYREALRLLESARPLYHKVGDEMSLLRLRWLEGKIAIALGHFTEAEEMLRSVSRELAERDLGYDVALLALDLAYIYKRQGRSAEMRRLAEEMLPIFQSRHIHREAIAALLVFQKSAEMERVTLGLIREVSGYLKETRATWARRSQEDR